MAVTWILVILGDPLPNLGGGNANYGIGRGVVVSVPAEDFDPQGALFDVVDVTGQSVLDNEAEEVGKTPAVTEKRTRQQPIQLIADRFSTRFFDHKLLLTHGPFATSRLDRLRL